MLWTFFFFIATVAGQSLESFFMPNTCYEVSLSHEDQQYSGVVAFQAGQQWWDFEEGSSYSFWMHDEKVSLLDWNDRTVHEYSLEELYETSPFFVDFYKIFYKDILPSPFKNSLQVDHMTLSREVDAIKVVWSAADTSIKLLLSTQASGPAPHFWFNTIEEF